MTRDSEPGRRQELLAAGLSFVRAAVQIAGVRQVSLLGSICTDRINPKDIDFLVVIGNDIDFDALATEGRRLKGRAQQVNRGADIFLATDHGEYIGRVCHYRECWPRRACRARHCGKVQHLNDDLDVVRLSAAIVGAPPLTVWPTVERRCQLPRDVEAFIGQLDKVRGIQDE
jgi:hypothetical protein